MLFNFCLITETHAQRCPWRSQQHLDLGDSDQPVSVWSWVFEQWSASMHGCLDRFRTFSQRFCKFYENKNLSESCFMVDEIFYLTVFFLLFLLLICISISFVFLSLLRVEIYFLKQSTLAVEIYFFFFCNFLTILCKKIKCVSVIQFLIKVEAKAQWINKI